MEHILRNSGKDYNDLGRYEDCLKTRSGYRYILASVPHALPIGVSVGLCVPQVCTVQDFNNFKSYIVQAINALIPELFAGVKGFDNRTRLVTDDLHFVDSYKRNAEVTSADAGSVFVILIFILMVVGTVGSSVAVWHYQKESKRRQDERRERNRIRREKEAAAVVIASNGDI